MTFDDMLKQLTAAQASFKAIEGGSPAKSDADTVNAVCQQVIPYIDDAAAVALGIISSSDAISTFVAKMNATQAEAAASAKV